MLGVQTARAAAAACAMRYCHPAQYGRVCLLRFCAHSSQSVALASSRAPQHPHRLKTRTPCGVTSRWIADE